MTDEVVRMAPEVSGGAMLEPEIVRQVRSLGQQGWGSRRIARELGVSRTTVRRYLRGAPAGFQVRPLGRRLDGPAREAALRLFEGEAQGNAVVVAQLLAERGVPASVRTIQRMVEERRRERRAEEVATVRYETAPGHQMQIDFGQKLVVIAGAPVKVFLLVAVLSYSRRIFVKAFLSERQDDWREGIAGAFRHFGGVTRTLLGDNAKALVKTRERSTGAVVFQPAYLQFCRDWDMEPRACGPYRARTKGKTESAVKYVKHNGLAGRTFESFVALEDHLSAWMAVADQRVHGTTHETPLARFERDERHALRPLPAMPLPARERRLRRRVSLDALVDVDTVRYSVPHRLVRDVVEVLVGDTAVSIYRGAHLVATHARSTEPYSRVIDPKHYEGLWRVPEAIPAPCTGEPSPLLALGRSLDEYAAIVDGRRS
jgi:transposase